MTHEFKKIIKGFQKAKESRLQCVIATVVALEGSSYRKPGVRMLIIENGTMIGAVSGGCVEKEILKQSHSVFKTGISKVMAYDGRYRLGCEGTLYILLELFNPEPTFIDAFNTSLNQHKSFTINSYYSKNIDADKSYGSTILFDDSLEFNFNQSVKKSVNTSNHLFNQTLKPCFRLVIIGAEHDAVELCIFASSLGWDVIIITSPTDPKSIEDFPGAHKMLHEAPGIFNNYIIKEQTAIVLMTHNYAKDFQYLIAMKEIIPDYIGVLGSVKRRETLLNDYMEHNPLVDDLFIEKIHSPAGLNIGAITPQEIALSICAEILAVTRGANPTSLKNVQQGIHTDNYLS